MSITTTPLLNLIKPDGSEHLTDWPWQNLVNSMRVDNKLKSQFLTYTPELTADTTDPTLGSGSTLSGKYVRLGNRLIVVYGRYRFGTSGINVGSGRYYFSLPVDADDSVYNIESDRAFDIIGRWSLRDDNFSTGNYLGAVEIDETNNKVHFTYGYQAGDFVGSADPFIPAEEDALSFYCFYQEAPL